jgi:hypothetical protein
MQKQLYQVLEHLENLMLPQCDNASVQAISREEVADMAWLAGILDGEGTMHLVALTEGSHGYVRPYVQIAVSNTNPYLIQKITRIWERQNVKFSIGLLKRKPRRDYLSITTTGLGSAKKVLGAVLPYLTAKKAQAVCLLSYIAWRETQGYHGITKELVAMGEKVREELHALRYQDFNLQRLSRTASRALNLE